MGRGGEKLGFCAWLTRSWRGSLAGREDCRRLGPLALGCCRVFRRGGSLGWLGSSSAENVGPINRHRVHVGAWAAYTRMLGQRAVLVLCPHHPQSMSIFLGTLSLTPYSFRRCLFEWRGP